MGKEIWIVKESLNQNIHCGHGRQGDTFSALRETCFNFLVYFMAAGVEPCSESKMSPLYIIHSAD